VDWENEIIKELAGCEYVGTFTFYFFLHSLGVLLPTSANCELLRARTMIGFIREMEKRFDGGAEGFVIKELGLTAEEVEGVRKGLRSEQTRE